MALAIKEKKRIGKFPVACQVDSNHFVLVYHTDLVGEEGRKTMVKVHDVLERNCIKLNTT